MSSHCMYWGSGAAMSADLKQTVRAVRKAKPEYFVGRSRNETAMDGEGRVTIVQTMEVRAQPMSPARRHQMSINHGKS